MSYGIRLIWDLIKSDQLLIEQKSSGLESPILSIDVTEYGIKNPVRYATSHDIKFIFESDAWKNMVISGAVFECMRSK